MHVAPWRKLEVATRGIELSSMVRARDSFVENRLRGTNTHGLNYGHRRKTEALWEWETDGEPAFITTACTIRWRWRGRLNITWEAREDCGSYNNRVRRDWSQTVNSKLGPHFCISLLHFCYFGLRFCFQRIHDIDGWQLLLVVSYSKLYFNLWPRTDYLTSFNLSTKVSTSKDIIPEVDQRITAHEPQK